MYKRDKVLDKGIQEVNAQGYDLSQWKKKIQNSQVNIKKINGQDHQLKNISDSSSEVVTKAGEINKINRNQFFSNRKPVKIDSPEQSKHNIEQFCNQNIKLNNQENNQDEIKFELKEPKKQIANLNSVIKKINHEHEQQKNKIKGEFQKQKKILSQEHQKQIQKLQSQKYASNLQIQKRTKKLLGQFYQGSMLELKQRHKCDIDQLKKYIQDKTYQTNNPIQAIKDEMKKQFSKQTDKIKSIHRKYIEDLNQKHKKQVDSFQAQKANLIQANNYILEQKQAIELKKTESEITVFEKTKSLQTTIKILKKQILQMETKQQILKTKIEQYQIKFNNTQSQISNKETIINLELNSLKEQRKKQLHQQSINILQKDNEMTMLKRNYQMKIKQIQKNSEQVKIELKQTMKLFQSELAQKEQQMQNLRLQIKKYNAEKLKQQSKKVQQENQFEQKVQQAVQKITVQRDRQYSIIFRGLQEKNNQNVAEIIALEGSNSILRQQITAGLNRSLKEKQLYQQVTRLKALLSNAQRRCQQQSFLSPRNHQKKSIEKKQQSRSFRNNMQFYRPQKIQNPQSSSNKYEQSFQKQHFNQSLPNVQKKVNEGSEFKKVSVFTPKQKFRS